MVNLAVSGYTKKQVTDQLHGRSGSRGIVKFRYELLSKEDVKLGELKAQPGRVALNSLAEIKRTAVFQITEQEAQDINWLSDRIRPVFCLQMPDGGWAEWPLGVFLLSSPTRKDVNKKIKREIEAYDSSLILKEDKFIDRYFIAAGTKYTVAINEILNAAGIWKINIIDHPGTLAADREFEIGTEKLFAVNELLAAINYTSLWVDENGYFMAQPYVLPSNRDPEYEYRTDDLSIIHLGAEEELDLFAAPNKFVRYVSNPDRAVILRSEYTNDLSTSPTSTINRGRTIVDIDHVDDIFDQATLDDYTKRLAYNASQVYGKFEFSTALMPHHSYYNCLFVEHSDFGIAHKYMESSWSMNLQAGGTMTHSCRRIIQI
jgi:hypothetical protein